MRRACEMCDERPPFSLSPCCFECLKDAQLVVDEYGKPLKPFDDGRGKGRQLYAARYRYRGVKCGKKDCPCSKTGVFHTYYVYRQWRVGTRAQETYLGPADELASGYELPQLRPPQNGGWKRRRQTR